MFSPDCSEAFPAKVACPAAFSDVQVGAYCGLEGRTQVPAACRYAEATCKCKHVGYCGGVTPTTLQQMGNDLGVSSTSLDSRLPRTCIARRALFDGRPDVRLRHLRQRDTMLVLEREVSLFDARDVDAAVTPRVSRGARTGWRHVNR